MTQHTINISNFSFHPNTIEIAVGDTVAWKNDDAMAHSATRTQTPDFDTGLIQPGQTSGPVKFDAASPNLSYFCKPHPFMTGIIVVKANVKSQSA